MSSTTIKKTKPQRTVCGMNQHNINEMKKKLVNEMARPTKGLNSYALKERKDKLMRMRHAIIEAKRLLARR